MSNPIYPSVWDKRWKYTNSKDTDIRKTFAKYGFKPSKKGKSNEQHDLVTARTDREH